jgi:hypothetical protein
MDEKRSREDKKVCSAEEADSDSSGSSTGAITMKMLTMSMHIILEARGTVGMGTQLLEVICVM